MLLVTIYKDLQALETCWDRKYKRESAASVHEKYLTPTSCLTVWRGHIRGNYSSRYQTVSVWYRDQANRYIIIALSLELAACHAGEVNQLVIHVQIHQHVEYARTDYCACLNMPGINLTLLL